MNLVIKIVSTAKRGTETHHRGRYIRFYDPFVFGGLGVFTTPDYKQAKSFTTMEEAMSFWKQLNPFNPVRPDGKPNRPLTAFTILVESR